MLTLCFIAFCLAGLVQPKELQFRNQGSQTIWVGILGKELLANGGFELLPGQQVRTKLPDCGFESHQKHQVLGTTSSRLLSFKLFNLYGKATKNYKLTT